MKPEVKVSDATRNSVAQLIEKARKTEANLSYMDAQVLPKVQDYDFRAPVTIRMSVSEYGIDVDLHLAAENPTDRETALIVADVVKIFGFKLDRVFNEYNGTFYWSGRNYGICDTVPEGETRVQVSINNVSSGKCEIRKVKKEVTEVREVYEAHCQD